MKAKDVHELTTNELNAKLTSLKQELYSLRFNHATGQLTNGNQLSQCKKDIARVLTVLREREMKGITDEPKTKTKKA